MNSRTGSVTALFLVLATAVVTRVAFLTLVPFEAVSADLQAWQVVASELRAGNNPYATTTFLNWPPLWMQLLFFFSTIADFFDCSLVRVIQGFLIATELVVILLTFRLLLRVGVDNPTRLLMVGFSLNPILVLQVCQHGNFDMVVAASILLAVLSCLSFHASGESVFWLFACLWVGIGIFAKTIPFILIPLLVAGWRYLPRPATVLGGILVFLPVMVGLGVLYVLEPAGVTENVLQYRSFAGFYGFTGLLQLGGLAGWFPFYRKVFLVFVLTVLLGAGGYTYQRIRVWGSLELVQLASLLLLLIPTFGPGYGPQYVCWFFPLLLAVYAACRPPLRQILAIAYLIAVATYLIEYALLPSHGAFLLWITDGAERLVELSRALAPQGGQTLLRLPLFAVYLILFVFLVKEIVVANHTANNRSVPS